MSDIVENAKQYKKILLRKQFTVRKLKRLFTISVYISYQFVLEK